MPTYSTDAPWAGQSRGTAAAWMAFFGRYHTDPAELQQLRLYTETIYRVAPAAGLGAHKLIGQMIHETTENGIPANSDAWRQTRNPAGIGVTSDEKRTWYDFKDGATAALAQLVHVGLYSLPKLPAILEAHRSKDPRAGAIPKEALGKRTTLGSFSGSRAGFVTWAADPEYGQKIAAKLNALEPIFEGTITPTQPTTPPAQPAQETSPMATHRFILSAGHRNTDGGGAIQEYVWTYPMTKMLRDTIVRRGGMAWIVQEQDGDNDPSFSVGRGLQNAARRCVELAASKGPFDAYISCHYEGAPARGFFGIHPDGGSGDYKANNPVDVELIETFARHVPKTGMPARKLQGHPTPGVMSERETGVGLQGFRLGEFVGTLGFRETTARVIIEAGSYSVLADRAMLWNWAWVQRYCDALVDGLEEMFGSFEAPKLPTTVTQPGVGRAYTLKTDLPLRREPGFSAAIVSWLPRGTKGNLVVPKDGSPNPVAKDGINWYDVSGPFGTGFVPGTILATLDLG